MLKEQTVIKKIIFCFSFLIAFLSNGQTKLDGVYSNLMPLQEHYNYYKFNQDGTFEYHIGASLGDDKYGLGEYTFKNNILILNYNKTKPLKKGYYIPEFWNNKTDSVEVYLNFYDSEHQPIPYVNVIYKDSLQKNGYNGGSADKFGEIRLSYSKSKESLELKCSILGFDQYKFVIDKTNNYQINVFLTKQGFGIPIYKQIDTLKIVEFGENYFISKEKPDKRIKWVKKE